MQIKVFDVVELKNKLFWSPVKLHHFINCLGYLETGQPSKLERKIIMTEFRYDTQLLIEGHDLDEDAINDYFVEHFRGDCLLAVGDDELIKIHFHTNEPWKVLEYCASLGEIHDIVVENMQLQSEGQHG